MALLQSRLQLVENSTELSDSVKAGITAKYRMAISNLELANTYIGQRKALEEAYRRMPAEIEVIRTAIAQHQEVDSVENLPVLENVNDDELERLREQELTDLKTAESMLESLRTALEEIVYRPMLARDRITKIRILLEEINRQENVRPEGTEHPLAREAEQLLIRSKALALEAEITMLNQELVNSRPQTQLLQLQREEGELNRKAIQSRWEAIRTALQERRRQTVEQIAAQADSLLQADTLWPVVSKRLVAANLELVDIQQRQMVLLDSLDMIYDRFQAVSLQLTSTFSRTRRKLALDAINAPLGRIIREERAKLPGRKTLAWEKRKIDQHNAAVSLQLIEREEERRKLIDQNAFVKNLLAEAGIDSTSAELRSGLKALAAARLELLDRTISNDVNLEQKLFAINQLLSELINKTREYDTYLDEQLIWVRSVQPYGTHTFAALPAATRFFLSADRWIQCGRNAISGFRRHPALLLLWLIAAVLIRQRQRILQALSATGDKIRSIRDYRITYSFKALGYTILIALPLPLILWSVGRSMALAPDQDSFSDGISYGITIFANLLIILSFIRTLFLSGGVVDSHLNWPGSLLKEMRRLLGRLIWFGLPFYMLSVCLVRVFIPGQDGGLSLLTFTVYMLMLSWFAYAFSHPAKGAIRFHLKKYRRSGLWNWPYLRFVLAFLIPPALAVLAWMGYTYTAVQFYFWLERSIWLFISLWLISFFARRWLLIMHNRLIYEAIQKEQEAATAGSGNGAPDGSAGEPPEEEQREIREELENLDHDTRQLFRAVIIVMAVLGLAGIWGKLLPALSILNDLSLWKQTIMINGVETVIAMTAADLLKAIFYGALAFVLAKNLPSLINILLIKQGKVSFGARYAIANLLKYIIVLVGILAVLVTLGVKSAQLGWIAAALSVGIGFGLQEIVANFISGIILLFERPVRIGDVITIGEASGIVTKIHIRATTIRDWERKELLIPNKELITGRLLNWTLSDYTIRLQIKVGVAYGSEVEKALELMRATAVNNNKVLKNPPPFAFFEEFGESALNLVLHAFIDNVEDRLVVITEMNEEINRKFKEAGIEIAFPQLDLHVRSGGK